MQICEHTDILEVGLLLNGVAAERDDHGYDVGRDDHHYDLCVAFVGGVRVDLLWCLCSFFLFSVSNFATTSTY